MPKPEWGVKRTCASCSTRFYDLARDPIVCPECGATFEIEALTRPRRSRPSPRPEGAKKVVVVEDAEDAVVDDEDEDVVLADVDDDDDDAAVVPAVAVEEEEDPLAADDDVLIEDEEDDADVAPLEGFDDDAEDEDRR